MVFKFKKYRIEMSERVKEWIEHDDFLKREIYKFEYDTNKTPSQFWENLKYKVSRLFEKKQITQNNDNTAENSLRKIFNESTKEALSPIPIKSVSENYWFGKHNELLKIMKKNRYKNSVHYAHTLGDVRRYKDEENIRDFYEEYGLTDEEIWKYRDCPIRRLVSDKEDTWMWSELPPHK